MNAQMVSFDPRLGRQIGHGFKGGDVFGAAIRIAGIVDRIHADEDVLATQDLGPGKGQRQHDGVAGRHVGNGNARLDTVGGHGDRGIGQGRAAKLGDAEIDHPMFARAERLNHAFGGFQLGVVALAVIKRQTVRFKALRAGDGETGGGIEAAG